jgi:hypothetical protein
MDDYEPLDVMDFIFHEIKHCIGGRHIPVYAPYVMMLLIVRLMLLLLLAVLSQV